MKNDPSKLLQKNKKGDKPEPSKESQNEIDESGSLEDQVGLGREGSLETLSRSPSKLSRLVLSPKGSTKPAHQNNDSQVSEHPEEVDGVPAAKQDDSDEDAVSPRNVSRQGRSRSDSRISPRSKLIAGEVLDPVDGVPMVSPRNKDGSSDNRRLPKNLVSPRFRPRSYTDGDVPTLASFRNFSRSQQSLKQRADQQPKDDTPSKPNSARGPSVRKNLT